MDENDSVASEASSPDSNETKTGPSIATPKEPSNGEQPEKMAAEPKAFWRESILALIQHANRSIVILLIAIMVGAGVVFAREPLACWLANAESVKAWSFEVKVREQAKSNELSAELSKLAELDDKQLQLFLVLGKQRESKAAGEYSIAYSGEEITGPNLDKLKEIGLLTGVEQTGPNTYKWKVTDTGLGLHKLLLQQVLSSIKDAARMAACSCETADCKCK